MPRSNSFCASALQDVSKWTLPSLSSSDWARADWANETPANAAKVSDIRAMIGLLCTAAPARRDPPALACVLSPPVSCDADADPATADQAGDLASEARGPRRRPRPIPIQLAPAMTRSIPRKRPRI